MKDRNLRQAVVMALLVASVAVHWPPQGAEFSQDDRDFVQVNASIRSLGTAWNALLAPFPPDQPGRALYRPLTNLSYALDHAAWGQNARGYHATNVLLYLVVVLLVSSAALPMFQQIISADFVQVAELDKICWRFFRY